jgi:hypothetical protein
LDTIDIGEHGDIKIPAVLRMSVTMDRTTKRLIEQMIGEEELVNTASIFLDEVLEKINTRKVKN